MSGIRTPLARVRGLGSARHGTGAFIAQRVSAAALVLLVLWAVYSALVLIRTDYANTVVWLHSPFNAVPVVLLIGVGFFHMHIGMSEIVLDYIEKPLTKTALLILNLFVCGFGALVAIFCILKLAFLSGGI
jgi:succinate dehydrogenase / fumarate reductase membrane anchor subunit